MNATVHHFDRPGIRTIDANGHLIRYAEQGAGWRYDTLLEKEPETIAWIDSFAPGDIFWDVGANVGIYSIYAAARGIRTFGFEPHFANYHQFCETIVLNGLQDNVTPLCLAFAGGKSVSELHLASLDVGASMNNFGAATDFRGNPFDATFRQGMIGYDMDGFIADFGMTVPNHLKIDVDGIELAIVQGAEVTLADPRLRSVSIELVDTDIAQVSAVMAIMERAGLYFIHKKQNAAFATPQTRDVLNFLFHRDPAALLAPEPASEEEDSYTVDQIVARIVRRIEDALLDSEPCGNIFMEDVFPASLYRTMLACLPDDAALNPIDHPDAMTGDGATTRFLLDLTPESIARLPIGEGQFWTAMTEMFTAPALTQAIVAKFAPTLRERFGDVLPQLVPVPIVYRDHAGYRIGIHPDAATKVATLQFYLPEDESQAHLGTSFHRRTADGFEKIKTNAFLPNSAYAFVRTDESWHSVDELGPQETARNSIALTWYIKGQEYRSIPASSPASAEASVATSPFYTADIAETFRSLAKAFTRRCDVAQLFPQGATGVELGVAAGEFSERLLKYPHIGYLYSIDMWAGDRGHGVEQYRDAIARLHPYRDRNATLRMRFDEALPLFPDESFDFLYVDGYAHDGELDGQTFREWLPKLKRGGVIAGDDYAPEWPLVVAAVDRFCAENGLELHVIDCHEDTWNSMYPTWFAMKP